jgi:ABC-type lipoprotein release transport system permease subunit
LGYVLGLHPPYVQLGLIALMTAPVCAIAAVLPARGAARLEPAVALRYD